MSLADLTAYIAKLTNPHQQIPISKVAVTGNHPGLLGSLWVHAQNAAAVPSTAAVPARTIVGGLGQGPSGGSLRLIAADIAQPVNSVVSTYGGLILIDRLSHQGGLSATVSTTQTTNLPTAALTRYTDGVGVMAAFEIYSNIGSTETTIFATYTNEAGTGSRTSELQSWGGLTLNAGVGAFLPIALQSGDMGVRSVESVKLAATTGTAGNFGITLFRPIALISTVRSAHIHAHGLDIMQLQAIDASACLALLIPGSLNIQPPNQARFYFAED